MSAVDHGPRIRACIDAANQWLRVERAAWETRKPPAEREVPLEYELAYDLVLCFVSIEKKVRRPELWPDLVDANWEARFQELVTRLHRFRHELREGSPAGSPYGDIVTETTNRCFKKAAHLLVRELADRRKEFSVTRLRKLSSRKPAL
jgi:hypothetical protein